MNICAKFPCGMSHMTGLCHDSYCPRTPAQFSISPTPSPRYLPVNIPFSLFGITVVTLDGHGNVEIKVEQPHPPSPQENVDGR